MDKYCGALLGWLDEGEGSYRACRCSHLRRRDLPASRALTRPQCMRLPLKRDCTRGKLALGRTDSNVVVRPAAGKLEGPIHSFFSVSRAASSTTACVIHSINMWYRWWVSFSLLMPLSSSFRMNSHSQVIKTCGISLSPSDAFFRVSLAVEEVYLLSHHCHVGHPGMNSRKGRS